MAELRLSSYGRRPWEQISSFHVLAKMRASTQDTVGDVNIGMVPQGWTVARSWRDLSRHAGSLCPLKEPPDDERPSDRPTDDLQALADECDRLQALIEVGPNVSFWVPAAQPAAD